MVNHGLLANSSAYGGNDPVFNVSNGEISAAMFNHPGIVQGNPNEPDSLFFDLPDGEVVVIELPGLKAGATYELSGNVYNISTGGGAHVRFEIKDGATTLLDETIAALGSFAHQFTSPNTIATLNLYGSGKQVGMKAVQIVEVAANTQTQNAVQQQVVEAVPEAGPVLVELGWDDFTLLATNTNDGPTPEFKYEGRLVDLWTWDYRMFAVVGLGGNYNVKSITATVQVDPTTTTPSTLSLQFGGVTRSADSDGEYTWDINQTTDRFTVKGWPRGRLLNLTVTAETV